MNKYYKPIGDKQGGFKLTLPAIVKMVDLYKFEYLAGGEARTFPKGTLVFVPVKTP